MASAAQVFNVAITATDKATAKIQAVNKKIQQATKPARDLGASLKKFADVSGITKVGMAFEKVRGSANKVASSIAGVASALGIVTASATVAGVAKVVGAWANFGTSLKNQAARAKMSASALYDLQNAVALLGGDRGAVSGGMATLEDNLKNIGSGRGAPEAVAALNTLRLSWRNLDGSTKTAAQILPEISDKLAGIQDPTYQAYLGSVLLGGSYDALAPALNNGSDALREAGDEARKHSRYSDAAAKAADDFRRKIEAVRQSATQVGNSLGEHLQPVLSQLLGDLSRWVDGHGPEVDAFFKGIATSVEGVDWTAVGAGVGSVASAFGSVVTAVGGWDVALKGVLGLMALRWVVGVLGPVGQLVSLLSTCSGVMTKIALAAPEMTAVALAIAGIAYELYKCKESYDAWQETRKADHDLKLATGPNPYKGNNMQILGEKGQLPDNLQAAWDAAHPKPTAPNSRRGGNVDLANAENGQWHNNNPTNLEYRQDQPGVIGRNGRWGVYGTPEAGIAAGLHQMILDQRRGYDSVSKEITRRSPPSENPTAEMIKTISGHAGMNPDAKYDLTDPAQAKRFLLADIAREGKAVTPEMVDRAINIARANGDPIGVGGGTGATAGGAPGGHVQVDVTHTNPPPGTTATVSSSGKGISTGPLVVKSMAGAGA
jgi:hypothetical protein